MISPEEHTSPTLLQVFAANVARHPDAPAVGDAGTLATYGELDAYADHLARELAACGVQRGDRVGLRLERGVNAVIGMLGVLKTGAAYVPVDPRYPDSQRDVILTAARVKVLVKQIKGRAPPSSMAPFDIVEWGSGSVFRTPPETREETPASEACVLYTSRSHASDEPVVFEHHQMVLLATSDGPCALTGDDRVAQLASISSGTGNFEIWRSLAAGAEIVVLPDIVELMASDVQRMLRRRRVTVMIAPAVAIAHVLHEDRDAFSVLRILCSTGDVLRPTTCRSLLTSGFSGRLINLYGSTGTTAACAAHTVLEVPPDQAVIPIGKALEGCYLQVLAPDFGQIARGDAGELYVGGHAVVRGRHPVELPLRGNPSDPVPGRCLYATGDLVRENENGDIELLGRIEDQVELRGHRIHPGDVERILCQYPEVNDAAVIIGGAAHGGHMVAFLIPTGESISLRGLCDFLQRVAPSHMIPEDFIVLPALPIDLHGKRDCGTLARLLEEKTRQRAEHVAPRNDVERYLVDSWEELLATRHVSVLDDFFLLGGHSLIAYKMYVDVMRDLGVDLPFQRVLENTMLQDLASVIEEARCT